MGLSKSFMKLVSWYDNEWGYRYNLSPSLYQCMHYNLVPECVWFWYSCSNRVLDLIEHMALVAATK